MKGLASIGALSEEAPAAAAIHSAFEPNPAAELISSNQSLTDRAVGYRMMIVVAKGGMEKPFVSEMSNL